MKAFVALIKRHCERYLHLSGLVCVILLSAFTCFYRMEAPSMWLDEVFCRVFSTMPVREILNSNNHHIQLTHLYFLLDKAAQSVFRDLDFAMRFFDVVFAFGAILVLFFLTRKLFGLGAAMLACVWLALDTTYISYAQYNRIYHAGSFFFLLTYYAWILFLDKRTVGRWLLIVFSSACALRIHEYSIIGLVSFVPVTLLLWVLSQIGGAKHDPPYRVTRTHLLYLSCAALAAAILWIPYTYRFLGWIREGVGSGGKETVDGFWQGPFPLTLQAVISFTWQSFLSKYFVHPIRVVIYALALAFLIGDVVYKRGRGLLLVFYVLIVTLPVIFLMNQARAAIMPKRFIYLMPVTWAAVAGAISYGVKLLSNATGWLFRHIKVPRQLCTGVVSVLLWCVIWLHYLLPKLQSSSYALFQYYFRERAPYKTTCLILRDKFLPGDVLYWHPPQNDSWLPTYSYVEGLSYINPRPLDDRLVNSNVVRSALNDTNSVWIHNYGAGNLGFQPSEYIELPMGGRITYVIQRLFSENQILRRREQMRYLSAILERSSYPEIPALEMLVIQITGEGKSEEAKALLMRYCKRFRFSRAAIDSIMKISGSIFGQSYTYALFREHAEACLWVPEVQLQCARLAIEAGAFVDAVRFARRYSLLTLSRDPQYALIIARGLKQLGDYHKSLRWYTRAHKDFTVSREKYPLSAADLQALEAERDEVWFLANPLEFIKKRTARNDYVHQPGLHEKVQQAVDLLIRQWTNRIHQSTRVREDAAWKSSVFNLLASELLTGKEGTKNCLSRAAVYRHVNAFTWHWLSRYYVACEGDQSWMPRWDDVYQYISITNFVTTQGAVGLSSHGWASPEFPALTGFNEGATNWSAEAYTTVRMAGVYTVDCLLASISNRQFDCSFNGNLLARVKEVQTESLHYQYRQWITLGSMRLTNGIVRITLKSDTSLPPHVFALALILSENESELKEVADAKTNVVKRALSKCSSLVVDVAQKDSLAFHEACVYISNGNER